ncbi:MAG: hypothetical protein H6R10_34 [Rhodocyclaceae bacterium]|nr:hypothetical protein [Rhodocyclaceae bacterium]
MIDEKRDLESGLPESAPQLPTVGSQLRAAREAKQMSVGDIAMTLKLGARQVEALENGDWQGLPGKTFIRGFVRNYARLLQVDPAPLMGQLDAVLESPQQRLALPEQKRQVTMPQTGRSRRSDFAMMWAGAALVAAAAAVYFLWPVDFSGLRSHVDSLVALFSKSDQEAEPARAPSAPASASQSEPVFPPGTTPQQVMNPQAVVPSEPASAPPPANPGAAQSPALQPLERLQQPSAPAAQPTQEPQPAAAADNVPALQFSVTEDSWIEVRDRHGKVLFSQLNRAGTEHSVDGRGPFSIVIGNAPGVKLALHGKPVDLATHTQGNVARMTLE